MNNITVLFLKREYFRDLPFFNESELIALTRKYLAANDSYDLASFVTSLSGEDACEEIFDITNNPNRDQERSKYFPNLRSLSVGDVVIFEDKFFLCCYFGWKVV